MKHALAIALVLLAGCTVGPPKLDKQAVEDFIEVRQLPEAELIHTDNSDGWRVLNNYQLLYTARDGKYLIVFSRICRELTDDRIITPDIRRNGNQIRARFDTIRGCQIGNIYQLSETDALELEQVGEAPGSRN